MNPIVQALQMLKATGTAADQGAGNLYNGIRNATMGFDKFFGIPDARIAPTSPVSNQQPMTVSAPTATPTSTPTPQVLAARISPTQAPTDYSKMFSNFNTAPVPQDLAPLIYHSAVNAGVDPNVFASLLFTEHGFQKTAGINKNTDGSYDRGIAQINSKAHPEVSDQQALDPSFAIPWAANLLSKHLNDFNGDYTKAIASYNVGEGGANTPRVMNNQGMYYVGKVTKGLSNELVKKLGIKSGN